MEYSLKRFFKCPSNQGFLPTCLKLATDKITQLQTALEALRESAGNETKSSAGDKFETARAMLQAEQERMGKQLKEAMEQKAAMEQMDISLQTRQAIKGSLVTTNKGLSVHQHCPW